MVPAHTHGLGDAALWAEAPLLFLDFLAFSEGAEDEVCFPGPYVGWAFTALAHVDDLFDAACPVFLGEAAHHHLVFFFE